MALSSALTCGVADRGAWLQTCVVSPDRGRAAAKGSQDEAVIRTPDRRLRVFVSSTLGELAEERLAVSRAIEVFSPRVSRVNGA